MKADPAHLDEAHRLYHRGLFLQAYDCLRQHADFPDWSCPETIILCQRVAAQLGGQRQARAWTLQARRRFPLSPLVHYYFARAIMYRQGPYQAWQWCGTHPLPADASSEIESDWLTFRGALAAMLRDFDTAEEFLDQALHLTPQSPWTWCERGYVFQLEDRPQEALATYQHARSIADSYVPAILGLAHAYEDLSRHDDAIALLSSCAARLEAGVVDYQLVGLYMERQQYSQALAALQQLDRLWPLADKDYRRGIAAIRSDAAYYCGDEPGAIAAAREVGKGFHATLADNLSAAAPDARRVLLPVEYVRQNHVTCAPATLTSLAHYWNVPVEHLDVVEKICYDGTAAHSERAWAIGQGFVAREFTVDWATTVALIDRGVPFTLTTTDVGNAHLQAVVGYDARRGTLLIRDPSSSRLGELMGAKGLEHYRSTGPRGMTIVPLAEQARLEGIELPDAVLYNDVHEFDQALERHDRAAAVQHFEHLRGTSPDHRLTHHARRTLAFYDADSVSGQHAQEQLCRLYPDSAVQQYARWQYMRGTAPRAERLAFLAEQAQKDDAPLLFQLDYAEELSDDSRDVPQARRYLRRLSRYRWGEARVQRLLARLAWNERQFVEAVGHYRLAACLAERDESHAWSYFQATRQTKTTTESLEWLESRCRRYGKKSSDPAQTLYGAYAALDRMTDARRVLDDALARRPDDGWLLLYAADALARTGEFDRAHELLTSAESKSHRTAWLQTSAEIASYQGETSRSLAAWRQVLELNPQSPSAITAIARLTGQLEGDDAARQFLRETLARFPHNVTLLQRTIDWFREGDATEYEQLLRRLIDANPVDAWARREMAIWFSQQERHDEAIAEGELAVLLDPSASTSHSVLGSLFEKARRVEPARAAFQRALELSVDNDSAIYGLMRLSSNHAERCAALQQVQAEMRKQTVYGDGLLTYVDMARGTLPNDEVLAEVRAAHAARPDLWHAWSALIRELLELDQLDEAERVARECVERFSFVPGAWLDLAKVCERRHNLVGQIEALEHALAINPTWGKPIYELSDAYRTQGDLAKCRDFVQQTLRRMPNDAVLHGCYADVQWTLGEQTAALDELERALGLDIDYTWAWGRLLDWGGECGQADRAERVARALTTSRPHLARAWYWLGRVITADARSAERREAFQKAIELAPQLLDAHVWLARSWRDTGEFDQALQVTETTAWGDRRPVGLRVEAVRIKAASGDIAGAITAAQSLTADQADDYDTWALLNQLATDRATDEDKAIALHSAEQMTRLAPHYAPAWAQLGDARRWHEDIGGAKEAYRRALEFDPSFEYCTNWLFDYAFEADELQTAGEVLDQALKSCVPSEFLLAREVQWACKSKQMERAQQALRRLIELPKHVNDWPLQAAMGALRDANASAEAILVLHERLSRPAAMPEVYEWWVRLSLQLKRWRECTADLRQRAAANPLWSAGAAAFLFQAGDQNEAELARAFIDEFASLLKQDNLSWAAGGYALVDTDPRFVTQFMGDWRSRENLSAWMLNNLANAHQARDEFAASLEVRRFAFNLPRDNAYAANLISLILDEIIAGDWEAADLRLADFDAAGIDVSRLSDYHRCLLNTVRTVLEARHLRGRQSFWSGVFATVSYINHRAKPFQKLRSDNPVLRRFHRRCALRLAENFGFVGKCVFWAWLH